MKDKIVNLIGNLINRFNTDLFFVTESSEWSIKWDGRYITNNLNQQGLLRAKVTTSHRFLSGKIVHFGSVNTLIDESGIKDTSKFKKVILTWFHIADGDGRVKYIPELNDKVDIVHTSCEFTKKELIKHGLIEDKIVVIPLGIDLDVFKVQKSERKAGFKKTLGLPKDSVVIGSFQKDGDGWEEGNKPKLVKGPDIFCDVVEKIAAKYKVHILLTGPARGYVKSRLNKAGIPYTHRFLENYLDIVDYYNVLDLYLVTSRAEGGPKAILECMACGIPFVSTKVGMAPDLVADGENGMLCEVDDIGGLIGKSLESIEGKESKNKTRNKSLLGLKRFDWSNISKQYYEKIYNKMLKK